MTHTPKTGKPRIGITLGDINGIGPEVVMKALLDARMLNLITPVIYGSTRVLSYYKKLLSLEDFSYGQVKTPGQFVPKAINVINCWEEAIEIQPGKPDTEAGRAALLSLKQAAADLKSGIIEALVTAPINKHVIHGSEFPFRGHTEFLADYFSVTDYLMFMVSEQLRVGLVTEHIPLKEVPLFISKDRIQTKLLIMEQTLRREFGINKPRMAVLGLNPHAGDGGLLGTEDDQLIKPVIDDLKNKGKLVFGPFPADGFFASGQYCRFDGILAMYHDQGLIPFKTISFESGVNLTAGLPVVRTSPDHGTAYSLAGKNAANESSMRQAIFTAVDILNVRRGMTDSN
ncbi:MAG: 4-hydroxythreonine-4-phosphate dehydrogenase PdxA [Cyclobacteriaceae bacterium]|nr:4-hydroxythreonine-4-phosphate dehydrogenase PdxA [Cyclobacteriaceae bacterium]MDW8330261.1 4-hydroxythreonine-4-phosphate dehydrogenase PdxA [Cyclobacteriaceae bacterium]